MVLEVRHKIPSCKLCLVTDLGSALLPRGPGEMRMLAMSARLSLMWPNTPMSLNTLFLSLSCASPICSEDQKVQSMFRQHILPYFLSSLGL